MSIAPKAATWQEVARNYELEVHPLEADLAAELAQVLKRAGLEAGSALLEAGCGSGHLSLLLGKSGYATDLLDFSELALQKAREAYRREHESDNGVTFLCGDLMRLSDLLSGKRYDLVWNSGVLEHFSRDALEKALGQMAAASCKLVLFVVPNPASLVYLAYRGRMLAEGRWDVGVEFLREDYLSAAQAAGLRLIEHGYCGRQYTQVQLEQVISAPQERRAFEEVLKGGQAEQALYLQYFLCAPDSSAARKGRVGEQPGTLDKTYYLDALGAANAAVTGYRRQLDATEQRLAADAATNRELAQRIQEIAASTQSLHALCVEKELRAQSLSIALEEHRKSAAIEVDGYRQREAALSAQLSAAQAELANLKAALAAKELEAQQLTARATAAEAARGDTESLVSACRAAGGALLTARTEALSIANLLEEWRDNKSFRAARLMQLMRDEVFTGPARKRLRFLGRTLGRAVGRGGPLSTLNIFSEPISRASSIAGTVDNALHTFDERLVGPLTPAVTPVLQSPLGALVAGLRPTRRKARANVVNMVTPLFLDFEGKELMCGGAERYLIELCQIVRRLGYRPEIYQAGHGHWVRYYHGTRVTGVDIGDDVNRLNARFHEQAPPGALTIYSPFHLAQPLCHPNGLGIGHGIFWDNEYYQSSPAMFQLTVASLRAGISNCSHVVSVDTNTINWVRATFRDYADKLSYVPNFVDTAQFKVKPQKTPGRTVVLYPRRLYGPRGFWLLAELLPRLLKRHRGLDVHFVGKADERETQAVRELEQKFAGRVKWYSLPPDRMHEAYQVADITLVPTIASEGTSLSCLEAMASGNAVIATNVGGLPELVTDGYSGLLISPTGEELGAAIERLVSDPALRGRLGENARHVALSYGMDVWRERWRSTLRRLLPARPASGGQREFVHLWAGGVVWGRMMQRPQQMFKALAEAGAQAHFVVDEQDARQQVDVDGRLRIIGRLSPIRAERPVIYIYFAYNYKQLDQFEDATVIYDILDDPKIYEEADRHAPADDNYLHYHDRLLREADIVMTSSRRLQERYRGQRADILLVPNGVRPEDFRRPAAPPPSDFPGGKGPVIGYYGAIAEWFDYDLLIKLARVRSEFRIVLIGPATRKPELKRITSMCPNVSYLGEKPYDQLPDYLAHFDVAMIPFVVNEITNSVSPVKLFEYLAAGKPVVSSGFEEVRQYAGPVLVAESHQDFISKIDEALAVAKDSDRRKAGDEVVEKNTWRARAQQVIDAVEGLNGPAAEPEPKAPPAAEVTTSRTPAARSLDEVTYELFEINPAEYYQQRFCYRDLANVDQVALAVRSTLEVQKIEYLLETIRRSGLSGAFNALEVGCGSGTIGAWVKHEFPQCRLYGVDLSADCIEMARQNGFDEVVAHDVINSLPYGDESFDFVFTMDFFGHIEFACKDRIIAEIQRVTARGGYGFHGIESGAIDYQNCDPKDPEDAVRKYVWNEGHVGVEPLGALVARFSKRFELLMALPWPLRPFQNIKNVLDTRFYGDRFNQAFEEIDSLNTRIGADILSAHCCKDFMDKYLQVFGPILTPAAVEKRGSDASVVKCAEELLQGAGFAILALRRPAK